jgi:hypothetical protein
MLRGCLALVGLVVVMAAATVLFVIKSFDSDIQTRSDLVAWVHEHGAQRRVEASRLRAHPPRAYREDRPLYFASRHGGGAVVGWITHEGIPARAWGVAYDPDGLIPGSTRLDFTWFGEFDLDRLRCEPIEGPWWYCRFT